MSKNIKFAAIAAVIFCGALFGASTVQAAVLSAPVLVYPVSNQTLTNYPRDAYFSWGKVSGTKKYEVQIVCDVCVSSKVKWQGAVSRFSASNSATFRVPGSDNQFRWRVRAVDANGQNGAWSDYKYFRYRTSKDITWVKPVIISPTPDQIFSNDSATSVLIDWLNVGNVSEYDIEVHRASDDVVIRHYTSSESRATFTLPSGETGGKYYAKVRTIYSGSRYGRWSDYRYFTVGHEQQPVSAPTITNPSENALVENASHVINLGWTSVPNAQYYKIVVFYDSQGGSQTFTAYNNYYDFTVDKDNDYYHFSVWAYFSDGTHTDYSPYRYFHYHYNGGSVSGVPAINSPYAEQVFTSNSVTASWTTVQNASRYDLNVQYESNSNWYDEGNYSASGASYALNFGYDNHYRLRVRAVSTSGSTGNWSEWRYFRVGENYNYSAPTINNPSENALIENTSRIVNLNWSSISNVQNYELEMYSDNYGVQSYTVYNNYFDYTASGDDTYYHFRVRARLNSGTYTDWSNYRYFHYRYNGGGSYSVPSIYVPSENQSYSDHSMNVDWSVVSGASRYDLEVQYESSGNWYSQGAYSSNYDYYQLYFSNDNHYRLRVRAVYSSGSYGNWSDYRYFYIGSGGGSGSLPSIYTPYEDQVFTSQSINADWSSVSNAVHYEVNVQYQSSGYWSNEGYYTASSDYYQLFLDEDNTYRMRVRAVFSDSSTGDWSDWREFVVNYYGTSSNVPSITQPSENAAINNHSRTIRLGWTTVYNVHNYEVEVACDWCYGGSQWAGANVYTMTSNYYDYYATGTDNTFRFRVRALKNDSTYTDWSSYRTFHYFQTAY